VAPFHQSFGELRNVTAIYLSFNTLVDLMLRWSALLVQLQVLFLSNNHLGGSIPAKIGQILTKTEKLDLSSNALTGTVSKALLCINYLTYYLDVSNNSLSGQIPFSCPNEKESLSSLVLFNGSSNHFSGNLPRKE